MVAGAVNGEIDMKTCLALLFLVCASSGCIDMTGPGFDEKNITYDVRDVHIGYEGGATILLVEYYKDNNVCFVDNRMRWDGRINSITIKKSWDNNSHLLWCASNRQEKKSRWHNNYYPRNKYVLYISDTMECKGTQTHTYHTDRKDDNSFIN